MGTAGPLALAREKLDDGSGKPFFVLNRWVAVGLHGDRRRPGLTWAGPCSSACSSDQMGGLPDCMHACCVCLLQQTAHDRWLQTGPGSCKLQAHVLPGSRLACVAAAKPPHTHTHGFAPWLMSACTRCPRRCPFPCQRRGVRVPSEGHARLPHLERRRGHYPGHQGAGTRGVAGRRVCGACAWGRPAWGVGAGGHAWAHAWGTDMGEGSTLERHMGRHAPAIRAYVHAFTRLQQGLIGADEWVCASVRHACYCTQAQACSTVSF
jgi:hypothetical protein